MIRKALKSDGQIAFDIRNRAILAQCVANYSLASMVKWTSGEMPEFFADVLAQHGHVYIVDEQVVALGMLDIVTGAVNAMFVCPTQMGKGIGKVMLAHLEATARAASIETLYLDATLNAAKFYRQCGFSGDNISTYHSPMGIDLACIKMTKKLVYP